MTVYPQIRTSADLLKSTIRIEELIPFLQQQKAEACAIVNTKLYGLLPFMSQMKKAGIHPVVGLTIQLEVTEDFSLPLVLYAKNQQGYKNLLKISSSVAIRTQQTMPLRWLSAYSNGIICVIPAMDQQMVWLNQSNDVLLATLKDSFREDLYIGISRTVESSVQEHLAVNMATSNSIKIMAETRTVTINADGIQEREVMYVRYELNQQTDVEGQAN